MTETTNIKLFKNANEFSQYIEKIVSETGQTHMETIIEYCAENDMCPSEVAKMISRSLKDKIEYEAKALNYLPRTATLEDF